MKSSKSFYLAFMLTLVLVCSCKSNPDPELTEPIVTLELSKTSPKTEIIISWESSNDAEGYSIERTMIRDSVTDTRFFEWIETNELCSKTDDKFYLTDNTCESGTEYSYVVTAYARRYHPVVWYTFSKQSEEKSITTEKDPNVTLVYPKNVQVEPTPDKHNALTVTWDAVENATMYEVYYQYNTWINFNEKFVKLGETEQTSYTKEYLPNETSYVFMIKAINGDKSSLFSAKATGIVEEACNLTKSKAIMLENGIIENFYSDADSLWYKCTPQDGVLSFYSKKDLQDTTLSIFLEDGTVVASGLPLFFPEDENPDKNISLLSNDDYDNAIARNIRNDIKDFSSGTTYVLRIVKYYINGFSICIK